jgi:hypothetical protein
MRTRIADFCSPGSGKHRVDTYLDEVYTNLQEALRAKAELATENQFLRRELHCAKGLNNLFLVQDEMNKAIHEPEFVSANLPFGSGEETVPLLRVDLEALAKG